MKSKSRLLFYLGNTLIVLSLIGFAYIFFPLLQTYLFPPKISNSLPSKGMFITIPKINAQAPVLENVDPWDEFSYKKALQKGVAHAKGTSLPGENGMIFLFAHSSGNPWELTRFNTIFLRLNELQKGDEINLTRDSIIYRYIVHSKKEVWPSEVNYLANSNDNQLILQTCTPIGTSLKRLLIFAE